MIQLVQLLLKLCRDRDRVCVVCVLCVVCACVLCVLVCACARAWLCVVVGGVWVGCGGVVCGCGCGGWCVRVCVCLCRAD